MENIIPFVWRKSSLPEMSEAEFGRWTRLLEQRTGMTLPLERKSFLLVNLRQRMREIHAANYQDYYYFLTSEASDSFIEWAHLVDRLTVHETRFFRHSPSLDLIEKKFLPQLSDNGSAALNIWSAGCATGEEAYTLAMLLDQYFTNRGQRVYFAVTGTDISRATLAAARRGIYHRHKLTNVPPALLQRYFTFVDSSHCQISAGLRKRVCFMQMNFIEMQRATLGKMDIVFCQNVLIYFSKARRIQILNSLVEKLKPGGFLVIGPGEIMQWQHPRMERVMHEDTLVYRHVTQQTATIPGEQFVCKSAQGLMQ
jgi:chemotaxis protein methyltransferase CheR/type IV pilus assembly protein PilK